MGLLSAHESIVWNEFQRGMSTSQIAEASRDPAWLRDRGVISESEAREALKRVKTLEKDIERAESTAERRRAERALERVQREWAWSPAYVSRVLNRARKKIERALRDHATSHRLDIESVLDYKGLLIGFDYQANAQVYIVFTKRLGIIVWYKHDSYAGRPCSECPKEAECRKTLDTIIEEYNLSLRDDERDLPMTEQSIAVFHKLAAKQVPRYKRKEAE